MTQTAIVAISLPGTRLARSLHRLLEGDNTLFLDRRFIFDGDNDSGNDGDDAIVFDLPVRPLIHQVFDDYQRLVLFMPVGAAVRLLAPRLEGKRQDPAVVCVDDGGRFAVSFVSGHTGGADQLAEAVAKALGGTPVITSASHATGTLAVDLLGQEFGWRVEADPIALTRASAAVINGQPVGIFQETGEPDWWPEDQALPQNLQVYTSLAAVESAGCAAVLLISDAANIADACLSAFIGKPVVVFRPRSLMVGMGCRKGVPSGELEDLLTTTFSRHGLAMDSIGCIATADLKENEPGILELAEKLGVPVQCYDSGALNAVFEPGGGNPPNPPLRKGGVEPAGLVPVPSEAPRRLVGIWGVCEPAALLASGGTELLVPKQKAARATVAVARKVYL